MPPLLRSILAAAALLAAACRANPDAKRLYDDLLSNYNRLIRPVSSNNDTVVVKLGLRLSQLIDLVSTYSGRREPAGVRQALISLCLQNLKDQILTTNVWLEHVSSLFLLSAAEST